MPSRVVSEISIFFFWRILNEYTTKIGIQELLFLLFLWSKWFFVQFHGFLFFFLLRQPWSWFMWPICPWTHLCSPASASRVLGPQAWTILPGYFLISGSNVPICFSPTPQHTVSSFCHHLCHCLVRFKVSSIIRPDFFHMSQQLIIFHMVRG